MALNSENENGEGLTISERLANGLYAMAGQSIAIKVVSLLSQTALAWILVESDYGLIGLAYTITTLASLVERGGVSEVLISRKRNFRHWVGTGSTVSLASGILAMALACFAAPTMANLYGEPRLALLVIALAIAMPIRAFSVVPFTFLKVKMRFRSVAFITVQAGLTRAFCTILFALLGFGAFSFAIAEVVAATVATVAAWWTVKNDFLPSFSLRFWKSLFRRSRTTLLSGLAYFCISQGDYVVLGSQMSASLVGVYFFAFSLASQFMFTFTASIVEVFTGAIVTLAREPERQITAICKSANVLTSTIAPLCVTQAIFAPPVMWFLWGRKWEDAIIIVQILSIAWSFRVLEPLNIAVFRANGRLKLQAQTTCLVAVAFIAILIFMVDRMGLIGAAISVVIYSATVPLPSLSLASSETFYNRSIFANAVLPTALTIVSYGTPYLICFAMGLDMAGFTPAVTVTTSGLIIYCYLTSRFNRVVFAEIKSRIQLSKVKAYANRKTCKVSEIR